MSHHIGSAHSPHRYSSFCLSDVASYSNLHTLWCDTFKYCLPVSFKRNSYIAGIIDSVSLPFIYFQFSLLLLLVLLLALWILCTEFGDLMSSFFIFSLQKLLFSYTMNLGKSCISHMLSGLFVFVRANGSA